MPSSRQTEEGKVNYAAEVFLDFLATAADDKDDEELVFWNAEVQALAQACGVEYPEVEPVTAGDLRANVLRARAALAKEEGP